MSSHDSTPTLTSSTPVLRFVPMTEDLSISLDGPRFASAFKAVTTTIGSQKADPDTFSVLWVSIWAGAGVELATFDGMRVSVAYVPQVPGEDRPQDQADYTSTVRLSGTFRGLAASCGRDSDQTVTLEPWQSDGAHLPGLEPPPGVRLSMDGSDEIGVSSSRGIETVHAGSNWYAYIMETAPVETVARMVANAETFKAVAAMTSTVGPMEIFQRVKHGGDVVVLSPEADAEMLGYEFISLMSWRPAVVHPEVADEVPSLDAVMTSGVRA